jgi:DNA-binding NtrC family response regulator
MSGDGAVTTNGRENRLRVLILDDERIVGERLKAAFSKHGWDMAVYTDPTTARKRLTDSEFDIVVTDLRMDAVDGIQILEHVMSTRPQTRVILITGYASVDAAREAVSKGAFDFIAKPFTAKDLREVIRKAALSLGHKDPGQTAKPENQPPD